MGVLRRWLSTAGAWFRSAPARDVEGQPLAAKPAPDDTLTYYWPRWRGSVKRIADLSLTLQEMLGVEVDKPIAVQWSPSFKHSYGPKEFAERLEETRLVRARLIEICLATASVSVAIRLSGRHGEPGVELTVSGSQRAAVFDRVKEMVELGEWQPLSSERLAEVGAFFVGTVPYMIFDRLAHSQSTVTQVVLLVGLLVGGSFFVFVYLLSIRALVRLLTPPLEIRSEGIQALKVLSSITRWVLVGLPAVFAIAAGFSKL